MTERHPVVFIHGLWLHASSWIPWLNLFAAHGYTAVAPGWPGEALTVRAARKSPAPQPGGGVSEVKERYARIMRKLTSRQRSRLHHRRRLVPTR